MQRLFCSAKGLIAIGAAAWLAGVSAFAPLPARAVGPTQSVGARESTDTVANPYLANERPFRQPPANPLGLKTTSWIAGAGEPAEADKPAFYQLPGATSFAPAPARLYDADEVPPVTTVSLPSPPLEKVLVATIPTAQLPTLPEKVPVAELLAENGSPTPTAAIASEGGDSTDDELPIENPSFDDSEEAPSTPWQAPDPVASRAEKAPIAQPVASVPMSTELTPLLLPAVQRGYALAQRGAMYAARAEFVQVLGRVVQAKDASANSDTHSQALAAGLRAIDEAEDFVPNGVRVEAELDVRIVASSHRTPVVRDAANEVSPHEAVALYHRYAQEQLALAVAGEQAASMALHGLGKVSATLAQRGNGDPALVRSATTMYSAALATCPMNHLAANELGVLLVREGRADEAARLFERTIDLWPNATAFHNLAIAQGKLGFHGEAAANEMESQRLAAAERAAGAVSRRAGVQWVTPAQMSGVAQPGLTPTAQVPPQPPKSRWQKTVDVAKSMPFVGGTTTR